MVLMFTSHIRILHYTKIHKHLINHVEGVVMTKCTVNCIKFPSPYGHNSRKTQLTRIYTNVHIFILGSRNVSQTSYKACGRSCDDKAHGELSQKVQKSITGVNLNGLGYPTSSF